MFNNATLFPPMPINNPTKTSGIILKPRHITLKRPPPRGYLDVRPDGSKHIKSRTWSVLSVGVMVLSSPTTLQHCGSYSLCYFNGGELTMYVEEMYSNALVRFFSTMKASPKI